MAKYQYHIGIIGGGIIGISTGWQLARQGYNVVLLEKNEVGKATSRVAAGMLAPHAEVKFEEVPLMKLGQESLAMYPRFLEELSEDAGKAPRFDKCGTLLVGIDRDDTARLKRFYEFRHELNLNVEWVGGMAARNQEPLLSPRVSSAIWLPEDAQVDNRALTIDLKKAFTNKGGVLWENTPVSDIDKISHGFVIKSGDDSFLCKELVIASGVWTPQINHLSGQQHPPVGPVKGQIITLTRSNEFDLSCMVRSPRVYLVPKQDQTIRVGATSEEKGYDLHSTAGGIKDILDDAWEILPGIYDLNLEEMNVGLRPATRDHGPVIGKSNNTGVYYATGHYRHGVLLTPITCYGILEELSTGHKLKILENFAPDRFN